MPRQKTLFESIHSKFFGPKPKRKVRIVRPKKRTAKKRNPSKKPVSKELRQAQALSKRFHGVETEVIVLEEKERKLPKYLVACGDMPEMQYEPRSHSSRGGITWQHKSGDRGEGRARGKRRPILAIDPKTKKPVVIPKGVRWSSERGLIG